MRRAIILHGTCSRQDYYDQSIPALSNQIWIPWLQKQLLMRRIDVYAPDIPFAYKPDYDRWQREIERYNIDADTTLVGHSTGGGFWVRWLSEHPSVNVGKVILVAPWLDPNNIKKTTFFNFEIDNNIVGRTQGLIIFASDNDHLGIRWSVETFRKSLPGHNYREFHDYGHFMDISTFPELLNEITGVQGVH